MKVSNMFRYIIYIMLIVVLGSQISCALASRGTITPPKSLDSIRADVGTKLDLGDPHIADTAMTIAADYPGEYNINQVCAIYDALARGGWYYYSDPSSGDSYQDANLTLQRGKISNTIGRGNCNDFAILMASLIESLGGSTRITFAYDTQNASGHAYAEVFLGDDGTAQVEDILRWLRSEYNLKALPGINKTGDKIWLNLDWGTDPAKAAYPGGPYFGEKDQGIGRYVVWEQNRKISPKIVPIIDSMDSAEGWEIVKDAKGSSINISSTPGRNGNALQVSYNLTVGGWAEIAKRIDPKNLTGVAGLNISYFAMGNQNTIELRLDYDNGTSFGVSWSKPKIDAWSSEKALYTDFTCLDQRNRIGFDLRSVRRIELIISNRPGNAPGSGTIILDNVRGVMAVPEGSPWARAEAEREAAIAKDLASQSEERSHSVVDSARLAVESLRHKETLEGFTALRRSMTLLLRPIASLDHDAPVTAVSFSPDGSKIATISSDKTVRIWDAQTGMQLQKLEHDYPVSAIDFSPDGARIATASNQTARIWNVETGKEFQRFEQKRVFSLVGSLDHLTTVAFSPNGKKLATGSCGGDRTARIWDVETGMQLQSLEHDDDVKTVIFSPDGSKIATATSDTVGIWDVETGKQLQKLEPDGPANGGYPSEIPSYQTLTSTFAPSLVDYLTFSLDGKMLVTYSPDNIVRIWDTHNGNELHRLECNNSPATAVAISPNGTKIATAFNNYTALIWDVETGKQLHKLKQDYQVKDMVFSPDGKKIVTCCYNNTARIWDVETGKQLQRLLQGDVIPGRESNYLTAVYSPDGTKIASTSSNAACACIWDVETGKLLEKLEHNAPIENVTFNPDGTKIATISLDRTTCIWDADTGKLLQRLELDYDANAIAFCREGNKIATASSDGLVRIWDVETGRQLDKLETNYPVRAISFSADGKKIALVGERNGNVVSIWDIDAGDLICEACSRLRSNLTSEDWMSQYCSKCQSKAD